FHGLADHADEAVPPLVPFCDQLLDDPADHGQAVADVGGVLASELDDLNRVPDDVVGTDGLEPKDLDADRPLADLAVPEGEARGKRLAADLGPPGGVDEEAEHVLLPAVEPGASAGSLLRRLEVRGEFAKHGYEVGVVEPGVAHPVDGAYEPVLGEKLEGFRALGKRLL